MEKTCPHCGFGVREMWHHRYGIQKLGEGWVEAGVPVVGVVRVRRETLVMGYVCDLTEEPSEFEGKSNGRQTPAASTRPTPGSRPNRFWSRKSNNQGTVVRCVEKLESMKQTVRDFYDIAFNQHNPELAASKYIGGEYHQHNPTAPDGRQAFVGFVSGFVKQFPALHVEIKRLVAEGDLVAVLSHMKVNSSDRGSAVMDIFRLKDGKLVEHWDVL